MLLMALGLSVPLFERRTLAVSMSEKLWNSAWSTDHRHNNIPAKLPNSYMDDPGSATSVKFASFSLR